MTFLCTKCHNIIRNDPSIKDGTLTCDNCGAKIKGTIEIYKNISNETLPKWLYLYQFDDTVEDHIIYNNKLIPMSEIKKIKLD